jgi:adenylosuccinate synthase
LPVSVVVGAQFGSEGKGKVAANWAALKNARAAVRVGGTNSGHTVVQDGEVRVFRQLPTACMQDGVMSILTPGSYIDPEVLIAEVEEAGLSPRRLAIDPDAIVITDADKRFEHETNLTGRIGSTGSGTGSAVRRRVSRDGTTTRAREVDELQPYLADTLSLQRGFLDEGARIVIEGTQGYGLSLLHGGHGDFATSRDTTASGFLSEAGLSPLDVDEVVLVARAFPIRVAGNSGPLPHETSWETLSDELGESLKEYTTVTRRVRRVGLFEPEIVRRAIAANRPTHLVLNHVDYVADLGTTAGVEAVRQFVREVEDSLGRRLDYLGTDRSEIRETATAL